MKANRVTTFALLLLVVVTMTAVSQPLRIDFKQAANNDNSSAQGEVVWVQSILQQNNSLYYEGMSVPQRIVLTNVASTQGDIHTLTFSHKATKNGKHAYDFLTSYAQALSAANAIVGPTVLHTLNECGAGIGPPRTLQQTCEAMRAGPYTYAVPLPDGMGSALSHNIAGSVTGFENRFGNRTLQLFGDAAFTTASISFDGYAFSGSDVTAEYTLTWESPSQSVLIEFAAHLAMGRDIPGAGTGIGYGSGLGAGSISGGSYHVKLDRLDGGALGSQDNQIMGAAVLTSLSCNTTGPNPVCAGTQNTYSFNSTASGLTYSWSLANNTSGASIVGSFTGQSVEVDAGTGPGEYTVSVIVRDGIQTMNCTYPVIVNGFTVTAATLPLLCRGGTTPVTVAATGGQPPYSGTGTFLRHAGTYTFTVTDAGGCSSSTTITVTEPSQLTASATASTILCNSSTAVVEVTATGGTPPYQGVGRFNRGAGQHTFDVTDAHSCVSTVTVTVAAPSPLIVSATAPNIPCCGGTSTVTVSASGGAPPYTGVGTFDRHAGTHTFTVVDANGCSETASVTITEPPTPLAITVNAPPIACFGGTSAVVVDATGGTPPYTGTGTFSRPAGTYTFSVTDANGCSATSAAVTISQPSASLTVAATATPILCNGGTSTVTVTAAGGTPPYSGAGTFNYSAGTYTFSVTDANGCTASSPSVTITEPSAALTVLATAAPISCHGGASAVTVTASGGTPPYSGTGTFNHTAGTYTFSVTDANGCTAASAPFTLTEPSAPLAITVSAPPILCNGGTSAVVVDATGGTPPYSGTGTFAHTAGTYTFTVTDANGCTASSAAVTITEPSTALTVAATAAPILCNGGTSAVTVTAAGGTPPYSGTGTFSYSAGTYTFSVTDANGCTASSASVTITEPSAALTVIVTAAPISCHGGTSAVTVTASGGTPPYSGTGTFNRTAGTYTFSVTDANGCAAASAPVTLTEPSAPLAITVSAPPILCNGGTSAVVVAATGGTPPYSGTGTFSHTAGTYTFTVTDANGCAATSAAVTITEPSTALTVVATAGPVLCNGGSTTVTVTAAGGTPPYTGAGTFSRSAGTYTFSVTDANGCTASSAPLTITGPASSLVVVVTAPPILCHGGTSAVIVDATGGTPPYSGTGTFNRTAGTYTFTVTDANGCSSTSGAVTITEPAAALAVVVSAPPILCNGGTSTVTVNATGGTPPYTGTGTFNRTAGTYSFTVTDANNCTASSGAVTITQPSAALAVAVSPTPILCNGGNSTVTVTATGGTPPYTGTGTLIRTAGTYTFTVTDANGCTAASAPVTITEPTAVGITVTATPILCNGGNSTVTVTANGGTPPYTGEGTFSLGAGSYSFTVTDANGCSASSSTQTLTEPAQLVVNVTAPPINCYGGTSSVTVTATGGTPPYAGTGTFSHGAGTYTFTVTDANGCVGTSQSVTITQPAAALTVAASATPILCNGGSSTVTVTAAGGTPPYSGTGTFNRSAGTYTFTVTDGNGCTASSASVTITEPSALSIAVNATPILCNGDLSTVTVTATGGTPPYIGAGTFTRAAGTYTFTVTDANGCSATSSVTTLTEPSQLVVDVQAPLILCHGGTSNVTVGATGGTPPYTGTGTFPLGPGSYTFTVTDANGCTSHSSVITLTDPPALLASATFTPILCNGGTSTVTLTATGGTPPYTGVGTHTLNAGSHTLTVTDANGCSAIATVTITEPPLLAALVNAPPVACGKDSATVTVTATGGTPPYTGTGTFKRLLGGYSFTVTDANGCTATTQVSVTGPPPLFAAANATPILCHGDLSTITVSAWGGVPPYTGIGTFSQGAGTYRFVVYDANNCTDTVEVSIIEPPELITTVSADPVVCNGDSTTVTVTATGGTPPYNGIGVFRRVAGVHRFVVTDGNGCSDSVTVSIQDPPTLTVAASADSILCYGDLSTVTVTASGGTPPYSGTGLFYVGAGTHTFSVVDSRGCMENVTVTITGPPELVALANAPVVVCGRDEAIINITATGGTPPYIGTGSFTRTSGTYAFVVTDANGCTDTVQATVLGPPPLYASAGATPILCHGGTSEVTISAWGGTPPYSGVGTFTYAAGTYTFVVVDANQCTDTVSLTILEPLPLIVTCAISDCEGGTRKLTSTVAGGTPPYSYYWSPFGVQTPTVDIPCSWFGQVTLHVRDANWDPNDPNNSACEGYCTMQVFAKEARSSSDPVSPNDYALYENYPNPFNPSTTIRYFVPEVSRVRLDIVNTLGQTITTLVDAEVPGGMHEVTWNALADHGAKAPSGSYIYRIHAKSLNGEREFVKERIMLLLK